jgi:23S rRNA pseudouridine1911/1915/1917 synthase
MDEPSHTLLIDRTHAGERVDRFLAHRLSVSRRRVWRLMRAGHVSLNGRPLAMREKGRALQAGDFLQVTPPAAAERPLPNAELSVPVAARGDGWLVVCKPVGMAVHPLAPDETDTVLNAVAHWEPGIVGVGDGGLRSGVVHRLDVATSGALVFALDDAIWHELRDAFQASRVEKTYHALVAGRVEAGASMTRHLRIARHSPAQVQVIDPKQTPRGDAWPCSLQYRPIERFQNLTLLEVNLETGFLHQIRAMLASVGHAALGDDRYHTPTDSPQQQPPMGGTIGRLMLHAYRVRYNEVEATCPWPDGFSSIIERLRAQRA